MSLVLSNCVLFILLMQQINEVKCLNITLLFVLLAAVGMTAMFATVIVPFTSIYAPL